jgi:hypothetical protein
MKYKRCCLERRGIVDAELRARDEFLVGLTAWLRAEHEDTLREASSHTTLIRIMRGPVGVSMSLIWALNDYAPTDGGPSLMTRYAERHDLTPSAQAIARGLAAARLGVYRVSTRTPGAWLEIEPLGQGMPVRIAWRDGLERLKAGEILLTRVVDATNMPTVWGLGASFPADSERRWQARLTTLPADPAEAALALIGFQPDDAAEPISDEIALHTLTWSIDDDEAVLEALEQLDEWECIGQAMPNAWAFAWPVEGTSGGTDLGGWDELPGEIEVARLIVGERDLTLVGADRRLLGTIARQLEDSLRDLIVTRSDALAA